MEIGPKAPDGGWGWAVLFGVVLANFLMIGHMKAFGVYYLPLIHRLGASSSQVAWIQALQYSIFTLLSVLASILSKVMGPRMVGLVGGSFMCLSLVLSSFAANLNYLYVTLGIIPGLCMSLSFNAAVTIVGVYFVERRGLANAVMMAGSVLGGIAIPLLVERLIEKYGLLGALMIAAGLMLNVCVGAMFWKPLTEDNDATKKLSDDGRIWSCSTWGVRLLQFCAEIRNATDTSFFASGTFYILTTSVLFHCLAYPVTQMFLPLRGQQLGLSAQEAASLLSVAAMADALGRLGIGLFADQNILPRHYVFVGGIFFSGISAFLLQFPHGYYGLVACTAAFGISCGVYLGLIISLFADAFGGERVALAHSLAVVLSSGTALGGPPLMAYILEKTGSYGICQTILGVAQLLGAAVWIFQPCVRKKEIPTSV